MGNFTRNVRPFESNVPVILGRVNTSFYVFQNAPNVQTMTATSTRKAPLRTLLLAPSNIQDEGRQGATAAHAELVVHVVKMLSNGTGREM